MSTRKPLRRMTDEELEAENQRLMREKTALLERQREIARIQTERTKASEKE